MLVADIKRAVAAEFGVTVDMLSEPAPKHKCNLNTYNISRPRQLAMALSVEMTRHSQSRIAMFFHRDRTTVIHARQAVNRRLRDDALLRAHTRNILRSLRA